MSPTAVRTPGPARRVVTTIAVLALIAALTTACSSKSNSTANSGSSGSGITAGGNDASPGVTADSIKIGYLLPDLGALQERLGFKTANYGGVAGETKQIEASVNAVNANGGLNGRKIVPIIKTYGGGQDSPEYAESFCNAFTQDEQVFAVVLEGQFQSNARTCYAARKTLMIDETLLAQDQTEFERLSPYLWSPTWPEYSSYLRTELAALQSQGWFTGTAGVSIVGVDNEIARRDITDIVIPFLTSNGITKSQSFFVDTSNVGTLGAGSSAALTGTANGGLDRVIVIGGARILPVMLSTQEATTTKAKFAISSYDSPLFLQDNPSVEVSSTLVGMTGFGVLPAGDIREDPTVPFPNPATPNQGLCKQIIDSAGATPPDGVRPNYKEGLQYCDATLFLKAVIDKAPKNLTANAFRDAAWQVGTGYSSAVTFGGTLAYGKYAATNTGRVLAFDSTTCLNPVSGKPGCFLYRGGNVPFATN
ncbi:MAG: hypothetical protein WCL12_03935 [Actinomycetes bacterium]